MSISLISSSSSVPPSAASNLPTRRATAPEKAPFSWPNSSDSSRFSGIAAQFSATNGPAGAARAAMDVARQHLLAGARLAGDQHRGLRRRPPARRGAPSPASPDRARSSRGFRRHAASRIAAIRSGSGGSGRNSRAPARIARAAASASSPVPQATTGTAMRSAASARTTAPTSCDQVAQHQIDARIGAQPHQRGIGVVRLVELRAARDRDARRLAQFAGERADDQDAHRRSNSPGRS